MYPSMSLNHVITVLHTSECFVTVRLIMHDKCVICCCSCIIIYIYEILIQQKWLFSFAWLFGKHEEIKLLDWFFLELVTAWWKSNRVWEMTISSTIYNKTHTHTHTHKWLISKVYEHSKTYLNITCISGCKSCHVYWVIFCSRSVQGGDIGRHILELAMHAAHTSDGLYSL